MKIKTHDATSIGLLAKIGTKCGLRPTNIKAIRNWLAEQCLAQVNAKLGQGGHAENQIPLRLVFVDLPVTENPDESHDSPYRAKFLEQFIQGTPVNLRQAWRGRGGLPSIDSSSEGDGNIEEAGGSKRRGAKHACGAMLLIGGPGQGKSTLGQLACQLHRVALLRTEMEFLGTAHRELVRSFLEPKTNGSKRNPARWPTQPFFPLQIPLPDFVAWLADSAPAQGKEPAPALLRYVADLPSAKTEGLTADTLFTLICSIPLLLVLDGFDEVGATQDRESIVSCTRELLGAMAHRGGLAQVLATTRPQGYRGELAQIGLSLAERHLIPLSPTEAMAYAEKLIHAKITSIDEQQKTLERLRDAAKDAATQRLLTTPLQVTILTALIQQFGRAPRERWNLFSRYFTYTYTREVERQTYASKLLSNYQTHIAQIHTRVALLLQVESEVAGAAAARMSRERLEGVIEAVLAEDEISEDIRRDLVKEIALAAEQRLVFLVEPEPGHFGFEIRSLQEFMAAWALTSGRDTQIEARLRQIANASMFRNVLLFAASRLFTEGSALRDVLAEDICGALDNSTDDEIARLAKSGALLALETLEEGAVLTQPKRARALMKRALALLMLPPSHEHPRLARVANSDTAIVLSEAIKEAIASEDQQFNLSSCWLCLIEATNNGEAWSEVLAEAIWAKEELRPRLVSVCRAFKVRLNPWLQGKIEQAGAVIAIDNLLPNRVPYEPTTLITHLLTAFNSEIRATGRIGYISTVYRSDEPHPAAKGLEAFSIQTTPWAAWVAVALFEACPTAANLANALRAIAKTEPMSRWSSFNWRSSWPLATCLASASSADDLLEFAAWSLAGELGDNRDWIAAEDSWMKSIDAIRILARVNSRLPWSLEELRESPPLLAMNMWGLHSVGRRAVSTSVLLKAADHAFQIATHPLMRKRLADLCLLTFSHASARQAEGLSPSKWLQEAEIAKIELLVPRPKSLKVGNWRQLLETVEQPRYPAWTSDCRALLNSIIESNGHPKVIRLALLTLDTTYWDIDASDEIWERTANVTKIRTGASASEIADAKMLRLFCGLVSPEHDNEIVHAVATAAETDESVWSCFFACLDDGRITIDRIGSLVAKAFHKIGATNRNAALAIEQLRKVLQTRRSKLSDRSVWDKLALPMPYPQPPMNRRVRAGMQLNPISIKSLDVRDIGGIHFLSLSFSLPPAGKGQWVVILGKNGTGKTTLLRSLALAFRNVADGAIWPSESLGRAWQRMPIGSDSRPTESKITVRLSDDSEYTTLIRSGETLSFTQDPRLEHPRLFPLFAYGCRRGSALGGTTREVNLKDSDGVEIATLFNESSDLIHAETWLLQLDAAAAKDPQEQAVFRAVLGALETLLDLETIEVDRQVWVTERGRPRLPFQALSDGYLTSAGWFLDLVARWIDLARRNHHPIGANFLLEMRGLVLIDEIDLHLHPRWQIEIVTRTRQVLPQMSFVVTSHNPLSLVGARAEEIWMLSEHDGKIRATNGIDTPMLLTGGQLYCKYFEIEDLYPNRFGQLLSRYSFLSGYAERTEEEEAELKAIEEQLESQGLAPGWQVVRRTKDISVTGSRG